MIVALVDYGMGNLGSVRNALAFVGADVRIVGSAPELDDAGAIVLPGVGAFGEGMRHLREAGLDAALVRNVGDRKKPFLGICLGLQLLAARSSELGEHDGLGLVEGDVVRIEGPSDLRVPQIGWNGVAGKGTLYADVPAGASFYFVHSYHLRPSDPAVVSGEVDYGSSLVASIERENVLAVQFHPEKSHKHGLALLKSFLRFAARA